VVKGYGEADEKAIWEQLKREQNNGGKRAYAVVWFGRSSLFNHA
jgi:hypothetical protein